MATYYLRLGDREIDAEIEDSPEGLRVNLDGTWHPVSLQRVGETARYVLVLGNRLLEVLVEEGTQGFDLQIGGAAYAVETVRKRRGRGEDSDQFVGGRWSLVAPLTGVVIDVRVTPGQQVAQNDVLVVVEAMKMLNELRARVAGEVGAVHIAERDRVEIGARLIEIVEVPPAPETS